MRKEQRNQSSRGTPTPIPSPNDCDLGDEHTTTEFSLLSARTFLWNAKGRLQLLQNQTGISISMPRDKAPKM